jgi:DNA-binding transcriptional ArsR family regulator
MFVTDQMIFKVAERLRALADENRIRILLRLKNSPANVSTLTTELGIAQASVSKHLAILRQVGILDVQRQGTQAIYRVRDESIFGLCEIVCAGVIEFVNDQHAALNGEVRESVQS